MKKIFIMPFILLACSQDKDSQLSSKIEPVLKKYVESLGLGKTDSIVILKIDTLNSRLIEIEKSSQYQQMHDDLMPEFEKRAQRAKLYKRLLTISYSDADNTMYQDYVSELRETYSEMKKFDSLSNFYFEKSISADTADFYGYIARFRYKFSDTTSGVQHSLDNGSIYITPDFKIKEKKSFIQ